MPLFELSKNLCYTSTHLQTTFTTYLEFYLLQGFLDDHGLANLTKQAENCKQLSEGDQWEEAIKCMDRMRSWIPLV